MAHDYDMLVIGGGAAGLTASGISASFGAKTLMVERDRLGGDCTWTGCVPSKTLLHSAKVAHQMRHASRYGLVDQPAAFDFGALMARMRAIREEVYADADAPEIYEDMGIDVRFGAARFVDPHTIALAGDDGTERISSRYVIIAAGASAFVPPIDGVDDVDVLTNETLFELTAQPERLAIVGAGPIGTEMAQAFTRLGTTVTVLERGDRILSRDDAELTTMLREVLEDEGVRYVFGADVQRIRQADDGTITVEAEVGGTTQTVEADALLLATGRRANVDGLGLDAAGVDYSARGITVSDRCRTSQRHIYAVGDVTGRYQFTHMSEHMAKVAVTNALLKLPSTIDADHVPWVTYTDPELGHVGATRQQLDEAGTSYEIYRFPYTKVDRAITEGQTTGLIKVYAKAWNGKILGADVLGASAGELISEYAVAMKNGVTLRHLADTIHPYPSYGLAARRAADQWYARKQSATVTRLLQTVFRYRGPVIAPDPDRIV
ncbi:MAG: FAD-dependent oxidoreductase [Bacteroidetes bacterium]|jgi:pyruvate/2-oxoglutarate dehydrogenase complex dihydrolipoamide dehydrogenase (E3) component|nr:FAD-dependent oxidoreductase [Bacteroidota bacterium]